jgi:hypothetical protein
MIPLSWSDTDSREPSTFPFVWRRRLLQSVLLALWLLCVDVTLQHERSRKSVVERASAPDHLILQACQWRGQWKVPYAGRRFLKGKLWDDNFSPLYTVIHWSPALFFPVSESTSF